MNKTYNQTVDRVNMVVVGVSKPFKDNNEWPQVSFNKRDIRLKPSDRRSN